MTDRDHFAAAALTGLLASREWPIDSDEATHYCYRVADAMLRERERTNLDAAPAAIASVESVAPQPTTRGDSDRTDKAAPRPSEGTGDTPRPISGCVSDRPKPIASEQEPVAWGVAGIGGVLATSISRIDAVGMQSEHECDTAVVPLYRQPPCQVFLQKNLTLTDAEREVVEWAIEVSDSLADCGATGTGGEESRESAVLRGLLERLGGGR